MNYSGIIIGLSTFLIIGIFHPVVIKSEYYFGKKCWWIFLALGIAGLVLSYIIANEIISAILGVFGFSCLWSIHEIFEQEKRVKKGWFPKNPKKK
jgi:hypothetical protein